MPAVMSQLGLLCQRYTGLDLEMLHATLLVVVRLELVGNARHRTLGRPCGLARNSLGLPPCCLRIVDPGLVKIEGTVGHTGSGLTGIDLAGVTTMQQLEQMVLRLPVAACIANGANR